MCSTTKPGCDPLEGGLPLLGRLSNHATGGRFDGVFARLSAVLGVFPAPTVPTRMIHLMGGLLPFGARSSRIVGNA